MRNQKDGNGFELGGRQCPRRFVRQSQAWLSFGREKVIERSFQLQANDVAGFAGFALAPQHCPAVTLQTYPGRLPACDTETSLL